MAKKKKQSAILTNLPMIIIGLFIVISLVGILVINLTNRDSRPTNNSNGVSNLSNPAVAEAKNVADKYFEAVRNCEVEKANSLRVLPKSPLPTREECIKECPEQIDYKFIGFLSYDADKFDGINTEIAIFNYRFGCGDATNPTSVQMTRTSIDNTWQLLNTN